MLRRLKGALAVASALLLIGAGCAGYQRTDVELRGPGPETMKEEEKGAPDDIDVAVDATLEGAEEEGTELQKADDGVGSSDAELNAFGQVYEKSEF